LNGRVDRAVKEFGGFVDSVGDPHLEHLLAGEAIEFDVLSAAMMTASAAAMSAAVKTFSAPIEPWVSTLIWWPAAAAAVCSFSAAMYVWAMPVGHAVTAT